MDSDLVETTASMRDRILGAASRAATDAGWAKLTMGGLANLVGVSRQTIYNEIGSKNDLAEAVVLSELERFLSEIEHAFDRNQGDLIGSIHAASLGVLELAGRSSLLRSVVSAHHGGDTEILPFLTTHSESLIGRVSERVAMCMAPYDVPFAQDKLDVAIDSVVRLVLSHVMQSAWSPEQAADHVAWIADRILRP